MSGFGILLEPGRPPERIERRPLLLPLDASLAEVRLPARLGAKRGAYWESLLATQEFFGRVVPDRAELDRAADAFDALAALADGGAGSPARRACAVTLTDGGAVLVGAVPAGPVPLGSGPVPLGQSPARADAACAPLAVAVRLVEVDPGDDPLTPRAAWEAHALQTNSRAPLDAFRRALAERGAVDALRAEPDGTLRPVLGSLVIRLGDHARDGIPSDSARPGALRWANATTVSPPMIDALRAGGALESVGLGILARERADRVRTDGERAGLRRAGLRRAELDAAEAAWWLSPEFDVLPVATAAGRAFGDGG